jgi:glutamate 5-kinase
MGDIMRTLHNARKKDLCAILVTSGAVKLGRHRMHDPDLPRAAAASVGQPILSCEYVRHARRLDRDIGEILLTRAEVAQRASRRNLEKNVAELLSRGIVPIINENDAVTAGTDLTFTDNDSLAAALAVSFNAKKLIILTHLDGLYDDNPAANPRARRIVRVDEAHTVLFKLISGKISDSGRGGMVSKIAAARLCTAIGIEVQIVNGRIAGNLAKALRHDKIGTTFHPRVFPRILNEKERWMLAAKNPIGSIEIDKGAEDALRQGKSLLAVGVKRVYGRFDKRDVIEVINSKKHSVAFGVVKKSSDNILPVVGTSKARGMQLVHADNIIVLP